METKVLLADFFGTNGAEVECASVRLGIAESSTDNEAILTGEGSLWALAQNLVVGEKGARNFLMLDDGATLTASSATLGNFLSSHSNQALLTGNLSTWTLGNSLTVGNIGPNNHLGVHNGALASAAFCFLGVEPSSSNNTIVVTGADSAWRTDESVIVGNRGRGNSVEIRDGGELFLDGDLFVGMFVSSAHNSIALFGPEARGLSIQGLVLGEQGAENYLTVQEGAFLSDEYAVIGREVTSSSNRVIISGSGSKWKHRSSLTIGENGPDNHVLIANGGHLCANSTHLGTEPSSTNNRLTVVNAELTLTNQFHTGLLEIVHGTVALQGGVGRINRIHLHEAATLELGPDFVLRKVNTIINDGRIVLQHPPPWEESVVITGRGVVEMLATN